MSHSLFISHFLGTSWLKRALNFPFYIYIQKHLFWKIFYSIHFAFEDYFLSIFKQYWRFSFYGIISSRRYRFPSKIPFIIYFRMFSWVRIFYFLRDVLIKRASNFPHTFCPINLKNIKLIYCSVPHSFCYSFYPSDYFYSSILWFILYTVFWPSIYAHFLHMSLPL